MSVTELPAAPNYGALTKQFTPASSCNRIALQTNVPFKATTVYGGHADCYPNTALWNFHYGFQNVGKHYYSPALSCPANYYVAATWTTSIFGLETNEAPSSGETALYCCPSSFTIGDYGNCYSNLTVGQVMTSETLSGTSWITGDTTSVPDSSTTPGVYAWSIQIRFQSTDLPTSSSSTSSRTASSSSTSSTSLPTVLSSGTGLSTGAKAAIGTVVPIAVISLLVGIFFFFRRRGQRGGGGALSPLEKEGTEPAKRTDLMGAGTHWRQEVPDTNIAELPGGGRAAELDESTMKHEAPGTEVEMVKHEAPGADVEVKKEEPGELPSS